MSKKIVLGSDIDEVIFEMVPLFLSKLKDKYNILASVEQITGDSLGEALGVHENKVYDSIMSTIGEGEYPLVKGAELLPMFSKDFAIGNMVYLISSRELRFSHITKEEINKNFPYLKYKLVLTNFGSKAEAINKYKINFFIEDQGKYVSDIINDTNCTVLLLDKPWNQYVTTNSRVVRIKDWYEIGLFLSNVR